MYMDYVPVPTMEGNPWVQMAQEAEGRVNSAGALVTNKLPGMVQSVNTQAGEMAQYGMSTAPASIPYPAHDNEWGLGQKVTPAGVDTSRGNPYMLQGEALTR